MSASIAIKNRSRGKDGREFESQPPPLGSSRKKQTAAADSFLEDAFSPLPQEENEKNGEAPSFIYLPPRISEERFPPLGAAFLLSLLIFLALPFSQILSSLKLNSALVQVTDLSLPAPEAIPPMPPPPEEKPQEEMKPELKKEVKPLSLSQLETALNPGYGDSLATGASVDLSFGMIPQTEALMRIFELKDLDHSPRAIYRAVPLYPLHCRREGIEGLVRLLIIIDAKGNVLKASVLSSTLSDFEKPSLDAVMRWKFEPGLRNGKPVMVKRVLPISFNMQS